MKNPTNITVKDMTMIAVIAVLYVILTVSVPAVSYGPIQFRVSELLNFSIIPKRKYAIGVILGVVIANVFSPFALDIVFGTLHTISAFLVCVLLFKFIKSKVLQYGIVVIAFSALICIVAYELCLLDNNFSIFWQTYATLAASEFVILTIGAPIMYTVEQQLTRQRFFTE